MNKPVMAQQVGGNHYKNMGIQPVEYATANGYDPCMFSIVKYVTRHAVKAGTEDVLKALHFLHMRTELWQRGPKPTCYRTITVEQYIKRKPHLGEDEIAILRDLDEWGRKPQLQGFVHAVEAKLHRILHRQYQYSYNNGDRK